VTQRSQIKTSTKPIRGVYVPYRHLHSKKWSEIIDLLNKTDLNAVVLDVKTDSGQVTVPSSDPLAKAAGIVAKPITPEFIKSLKDQGIYTIARITTFKDPHMAKLRPQLSLQNKGGGVWYDAKGVAWLDPYQSEVRSYAISLAKAAATAGFDEVQFDYVRFPENGAKVDRQVRYANPNGTSKAEIIAAFLKEAKTQLASTPLRISADVFGLTTSAADDMGIGQDWSRLTTTADILCPMVYPSHYAKGTYGVAQPDLQPYLIIQRAVQAGLAKNRKVQTSASIRPWLQDFTAKWVKPHQTYGTEQVREQVKALEESGIYEFLLWNPNASYSYR
jgi:hypothetical protein